MIAITALWAVIGEN